MLKWSKLKGFIGRHRFATAYWCFWFLAYAFLFFMILQSVEDSVPTITSDVEVLIEIVKNILFSATLYLGFPLLHIGYVWLLKTAKNKGLISLDWCQILISWGYLFNFITMTVLWFLTVLGAAISSDSF